MAFTIYYLVSFSNKLGSSLGMNSKPPSRRRKERNIKDIDLEKYW
jgi:hypothetical protein